jgi:anaerobic C4-dicarboxylate transporter
MQTEHVVISPSQPTECNGTHAKEVEPTRGATLHQTPRALLSGDTVYNKRLTTQRMDIEKTTKQKKMKKKKKKTVMIMVKKMITIAIGWRNVNTRTDFQLLRSSQESEEICT